MYIPIAPASVAVVVLGLWLFGVVCGTPVLNRGAPTRLSTGKTGLRAY